MSKKAWFTQWFNSSHYHQLYSHRDEKEAADFIYRLLIHLHPAPGSSILDLGCGRGRHSRILASMGYQVTGIDVAPENINYANRYATESLQFQVHDMRRMLCVRCFDFVFNFFTSFGFFNTEREHLSALRTMSTALKKNGVLVMDYINSPVASQNLVPLEEKLLRGNGYRIERWQNETHFFKKITVTEDPENKQGPVSFTEQVAKFSLEKLKSMIEEQGLKVEEVFGDYLLNAYDPLKSPRMILVARRSQ